MLELHSGDLIADRFRVEALLGEGGIARVYRVRHVRLGSVHAVKILMLHRPALADRLLLEGRIQAQLRHPNLVRVTDVVEHAGNPCLVMEFVDGTHLQALLADSGPLPIQGALELFAGVLSAVAAAHDQGVLHRDLKPANILLERSRRGLIPKVSDFGIAKVASEGLREGQTRVGVQMGTPGYMAPEQVEDSARVDHRADIFALGAILYEMLTGARPFQEDTTFRTMQATLAGRFPPVELRRGDCPTQVVQAINIALSVPMEERFPDCHAFADVVFREHPGLRGRIERVVAVALPEGLHRPEITQATPSLSTPAEGSAAPAASSGAARGPRSQPTIVAPEALLPAPDDNSTEEPPSTPAGSPPPAVGAIGVATSSDDTPSSSLAASLSPMRQDGAEAGRAAIAIGGEDPVPDALPDLDQPRARRSPLLPLAAAALLLAAAGAGGWAWLQGQQARGIEVEEVGTPATLGEQVDPPEQPPSPEPEQPAGEQAPSPAPPQPAAEQPGSQAEARPEVPATTSTARTAEPAEEPAAEEPAAEEPAAEPPAAEPSAAEPSAAGPPAEEPVAGDPAAEDPAAEEPAAEEPAAEEPAAEEPAAEVAATSEPLPPGDATAEVAPGQEPAPPPQAQAAPVQPPALQGTWKGLANDNPLTIRITSQDGSRLVGELSFTQGAIQRVARVTGTVDAASNRLSLSEEGGAGLLFSGVVRGTGMMGTYGRSGKPSNLSWSATRQ